jgi:hypothetical protein
MLKLIKHLPILTVYLPISRVNFLVQVFLFLAQWWIVNEQVRGKEQTEDKVIRAQFMLLSYAGYYKRDTSKDLFGKISLINSNF